MQENEKPERYESQFDRKVDSFIYRQAYTLGKWKKIDVT